MKAAAAKVGEAAEEVAVFVEKFSFLGKKNKPICV
jgi:hypothetical protein